MLRGIWDLIPEATEADWVDAVAKLPATNESLGDYGPLVKRMLDSGLTPQEIARFSRMVGYEVAFGFCVHLEDPDLEPESLDSEYGDYGPWRLFTVDSRGIPLEPLNGLHEELLGCDPDGHEMRPPSPSTENQ